MSPVFQIGPIVLDNPTVLAPLAGITNLPFRLMAKEAGCALVYSEMVSSHGLVYGSGKTERIMETCPHEKPVAIQIFGADPSMMAEAARLVQASGADILDINFGCAVRKILKSGSGAALMKDPDRAEALLTEVRKAVDIPLTIKIRSGWDRSGDQALHIARIAEDCGVDAVAVHPRTAGQGFSGRADWSVIARVKSAVAIPVIGNGDVETPEDALRMLHQTGCDAVMIGRAAVGAPWLFSQVLAALAGAPPQAPDTEARMALMRRYLRESVAYLGEEKACPMMRSRLGWFIRGLPYSALFRNAIKHISAEAEALRIIDAFAAFLASDDRDPDRLSGSGLFPDRTAGDDA